MKVLESIKKTMESLELSRKNEDCPICAEIIEKHSDIPADKVKEIIKDTKAAFFNKQDITEEDSAVEVTGSTQDVAGDAGITDANDEPKERIVELDASEADDAIEENPEVEEPVAEADEEPVEIEDKTDAEDFIEEEPVAEADEEVTIDEEPVAEADDEEIDDELIISEEDEEIDDELIISEEEEDEESFEDYDPYKDELDLVEEDDEPMNDEGEEEDFAAMDEEDEEDFEEDEYKNEANTGAKAAMANMYDGKDTFSSDVDELTDYLKEY